MHVRTVLGPKLTLSFLLITTALANIVQTVDCAGWSMRVDEYSQGQSELCSRYGAPFLPVELYSKLGAAPNIKGDLKPLNGLRHPPQSGTNGWYLWCGPDFPVGNDAFLPLHTRHVKGWNSLALKYLGLPPGWRFLTDGKYEDVWFDETLLDI